MNSEAISGHASARSAITQKGRELAGDLQAELDRFDIDSCSRRQARKGQTVELLEAAELSEGARRFYNRIREAK